MLPPGRTPDRKRLLKATGVAFIAASLLVITVVLPAEYGVDPTGFGRALGFARLADPGSGADVGASNGSRILFSHQYVWELKEDVVREETHVHLETKTEERVQLAMNVTNLTLVRAELDWTDAPESEPDLFEISIRAPDGRRSQLIWAQNGADGRGNLSTSLRWQSVPFPEPNATYALAEADPSGNGTWEVLVRLYRAGEHRNGSADDGNEWRLRIFAQTYTARILRTGLDAADSVSLALRGGGAVEYKFFLEKNATMTYVWRATRPITFDFHGDDRNQPDADPISHAQGVSAQGTGEFRAPFTGRHGWWWYNQGQDPVTVTLQTSGDYSIIGVI